MQKHTSHSIDLNADLGEGCGHDEDIMPHISSANIACGGHAGDIQSMKTALELALKFGVNAGAHPSYPDKENFGRTRIEVPREDLELSLREQISTLRKVAEHSNTGLTHVKPHGALYHDASFDMSLAEMMVRLAKDLLGDVAIIGPPGSALHRAAMAHRLSFVGEGFADRAYQNDGRLVPRDVEGGVIHNIHQQTAQTLSLAKNAVVTTLSGQTIPMPVETICVHGDHPEAVKSANAIHACLRENGFEIRGSE